MIFFKLFILIGELLCIKKGETGGYIITVIAASFRLHTAVCNPSENITLCPTAMRERSGGHIITLTFPLFTHLHTSYVSIQSCEFNCAKWIIA